MNKEDIILWLKNEKILGKETIEVDWQSAEMIKELIGEKNRTGSDCNKMKNINSVRDVRCKEAKYQVNKEEVKQNITVSDVMEQELRKLRNLVQECKKCSLWKERKKVVFGAGSIKSKLMFIGEAPGMMEDSQGEPFVGDAGKLLTTLIESIGLKRQDVFIANIIKCRPPRNRDPLQHEIEQCYQWLMAQLSLINPVLICTLGKFSTYTLLGESKSFAEIRGKIYEHKIICSDKHSYVVKVIPTYHPAALLYHPAWKSLVEQDFKLIGRLYGEK